MDKLQELQNNLDAFKASLFPVSMMEEEFIERIYKPFTELLKELGLREPSGYIVDEGEEFEIWPRNKRVCWLKGNVDKKGVISIYLWAMDFGKRGGEIARLVGLYIKN